MSTSNSHLSSETLQAHLKSELAEEQTHRVEAHLAECARCTSELDAWRLVFSRLKEIPNLSPSESFQEGVMARVPTRKPFLSRISDWIRATVGGGPAGADTHLEPSRIQDLLDGTLGWGNRRRVERHLSACGRCGTEVRRWSRLVATLETLPRLEPSEGFAARTMAAFQTVRTTTPAKPFTPAATVTALWDRCWAAFQVEIDRAEKAAVHAAQGLLPDTPRGWAWLAAAASLPAVGILVMAGAVVAHPLLTLEGLALFLRRQIADGFTVAGGWVADRAADGPALLQLREAAGILFAAPGLALTLLLAFWVATLISAWILYRNLIAPSTPGGQHARI